MAAMTRNSFISAAVILIGCFVSIIGLFEPTKTLFSTGQTLFWAGMIQSYFGAVLEIESSKRIWPITIGILVSIVVGFVAFRSLRDDLPNGYWICCVIIVALLLQILISYVTLRVWKNRQRVEMQ
jgi:hypothetical protein